jgi:hypothetical protein
MVSVDVTTLITEEDGTNSLPDYLQAKREVV